MAAAKEYIVQQNISAKLRYLTIRLRARVFYEQIVNEALLKLLKVYNFRNIVHFLKRILQVVDNAVFLQNVLLCFENDPLSPSF